VRIVNVIIVLLLNAEQLILRSKLVINIYSVRHSDEHNEITVYQTVVDPWRKV
jgi:hypothetical protein